MGLRGYLKSGGKPKKLDPRTLWLWMEPDGVLHTNVGMPETLSLLESASQLIRENIQKQEETHREAAKILLADWERKQPAEQHPPISLKGAYPAGAPEVGSPQPETYQHTLHDIRDIFPDPQ